MPWDDDFKLPVPKRDVRDIDDLADPSRRASLPTRGRAFSEKFRTRGAIDLTRLRKELADVLRELELSLTDLAHARVERTRAVNMLKNIDTILQGDNEALEARRLNMQNACEDANHQLQLGRKRRHAELHGQLPTHSSAPRQITGSSYPPLGHSFNQPSGTRSEPTVEIIPPERVGGAGESYNNSPTDRAEALREISGMEHQLNQFRDALGGEANMDTAAKEKYDRGRAMVQVLKEFV